MINYLHVKGQSGVDMILAVYVSIDELSDLAVNVITDKLPAISSR